MQITCIETTAGPRVRVSYYDSTRQGNIRKLFKTEKEAKAFAKSVEKGKKHNIPTRIIQASMSRLNDIDRALGVLGDHNLSLAEAAEFFLAHKRETELLKDMPAFDLIKQEFIQAKRSSGIRETSIKSYEQALDALGSRIPSGLQKATREQLRDALDGAKLSPVSRNSYIRIGKMFFNWLRDERYRKDNPFDAIQLVRVEKSDPCIYTTDQAQAIMRAVEKLCPQYARAYAIALFAGIRPEAIAKLTDGDINLEEGAIQVGWAQDKTHQKYFADISPNLRAWLERYTDDQEYQVPRYWRQRICTAAEVNHGHDIFRHSFASHHLACYQSLDKTTHALNHRSSDMLYRHYRAAVSGKEGERYFQILPSGQTADSKP